MILHCLDDFFTAGPPTTGVCSSNTIAMLSFCNAILLLESEWSFAPQMHLYTDASNIGFGLFWDGRWFNSTWSREMLANPITWKELYTVVVACATWGTKWARKRILFHCGNAAVVDIWQKLSCKFPEIIGQVRTLYLLAATGNHHVGLAHIPGTDNSYVPSLYAGIPQTQSGCKHTTDPNHPSTVFGQS